MYKSNAAIDVLTANKLPRWKHPSPSHTKRQMYTDVLCVYVKALCCVSQCNVHNAYLTTTTFSD